MRTKTEVNYLRDRGIATEIFTHSVIGSFNVSELRILIRGWRNPLRSKPLINIHTSKFKEMMGPDGLSGDEVVKWLITQREIDEARVASLTSIEIDEPLFNVICEDGTSVIIDGMHRFVRRWRDGMVFFRCYTVPLRACPMIDPNDPSVMNLDWGQMEVVGDELRKVR